MGNHFEQAKLWLDAANYLASLPNEGNDKYAVAIAMAIHAIIKTNDTLTFKFMHTLARRHDDARRLFEDLIKKNFIKSEHAHYKQTIQDAINNKAKAEYRAAYFSKNDFEKMQKKAERFLNMVKTIT